MDILRLPIFSVLEQSETVLIAGAGGGYDIFTGLPLYFALRQAGKNVHLANLSFAKIYASTGRRIGPALVEINASTEGPAEYFPDLCLAGWLKQGDAGHDLLH